MLHAWLFISGYAGLLEANILPFLRAMSSADNLDFPKLRKFIRSLILASFRKTSHTTRFSVLVERPLFRSAAILLKKKTASLTKDLVSLVNKSCNETLAQN